MLPLMMETYLISTFIMYQRFFFRHESKKSDLQFVYHGCKGRDISLKWQTKPNFSSFFFKTFWEIQNKAITLHPHSAKGILPYK